jgi:hypothetical protein
MRDIGSILIMRNGETREPDENNNKKQKKKKERPSTLALLAPHSNQLSYGTILLLMTKLLVL